MGVTRKFFYFGSPSTYLTEHKFHILPSLQIPSRSTYFTISMHSPFIHTFFWYPYPHIFILHILLPIITLSWSVTIHPHILSLLPLTTTLAFVDATPAVLEALQM